MLNGFLLKTSVCPEILCYTFSSISENSKNKNTGLTPSPVFARTIYKQPLNNFMIFFGLNSTAIVLGCDGVASVRVCYHQGHRLYLQMIVKLFLCCVALNTLITVFNFWFICKSKQDIPSTHLQNYYIQIVWIFLFFKKYSLIH